MTCILLTPQLFSCCFPGLCKLVQDSSTVLFFKFIEGFSRSFPYPVDQHYESFHNTYCAWH